MTVPTTTGAGVSGDVARLHQLGYPQQLQRRLGPFAAFSTPFSNISYLSGPITLFTLAMLTGGPAPLMWTWIIGGIPVLCVAYAMAELTSSMPTSGGLYFWSAQLAKKYSVLWSWITAWLNAVGGLAGVATAAYSAALFSNAFAAITWGAHVTPRTTLATFAAILVLGAVLNTCAVRVVAWINETSVVVHIGGGLLICAALNFIPQHHQSVHFVFTDFVNGTGINSTWYVWLLAPLTLMYTMTGLDSSAHMSEVTTDAERVAPKAIVRALIWSWVLGLLLIFSLVRGIQNFSGEAASAYGVFPAAEIMDAIGGVRGQVLIGVIIVAQIQCVISCFTTMSHMGYAVGRDGVFPGSSQLRQTSRQRVPVKAVLLGAAATFVIGIPAYFNLTLFFGIASIAAVALFISYGIPIALRLRRGKAFKPGSFRLRHPYLVGGIAIGYVTVGTVLACLPTTSPINHDTFNYTPVALAATVIGVLCYYALRGKKTYAGPKHYSDEEIKLAEDAVA